MSRGPAGWDEDPHVGKMENEAYTIEPQTRLRMPRTELEQVLVESYGSIRLTLLWRTGFIVRR